MRKAQQKPLPSVTEVVDDMEDLNVEQRDQNEESRCSNNAGCCGRDGANSDCCCNVRGANEGSQRILSHGSFSTRQLLKCCLDLVIELGLPEELKLHIQQLIDT